MPATTPPSQKESLTQDLVKKAFKNGCEIVVMCVYDPTETIPELLLRAAPHKSRERVYELDQIADDMYLLVIRLPSYHYQFYPLQLIWAEVKGKVA
jgi:beta-glucosidase-like glycosyl hydrolase